MNYLNEAFQKLNLLTEDDFDLSIDKDKVDELRSFVADDIDAIDEEPIIDVEAETDDDLKDNYIGKVIVECDCCHSRLYKDIDKVVIDDETGLANIEEECPVCGTASGYTVIGKIEEFNKDANFEPKEEEDEIEDDAAEKGADEEHDEEEIDDDDVTEALKEALGLNDLAKEEKEKLEKSAITEAEVCPECGDVIDDEHPMCDKCKEKAAEKEEIEEACEDCLDEAYAQEIDWAADEDDLSTEEAVIASIKEAGLPEGIDVMVLDLEGPDTGWPLVRLTGPKDLVDGFLRDTGFEDLLDDEDFDEGMKNMAIDSKKDKDIEDALDNLSDEELARLSELSKAKDESINEAADGNFKILMAKDFGEDYYGDQRVIFEYNGQIYNYFNGDTADGAVEEISKEYSLENALHEYNRKTISKAPDATWYIENPKYLMICADKLEKSGQKTLRLNGDDFDILGDYMAQEESGDMGESLKNSKFASEDSKKLDEALDTQEIKIKSADDLVELNSDSAGDLFDQLADYDGYDMASELCKDIDQTGWGYDPENMWLATRDDVDDWGRNGPYNPGNKSRAAINKIKDNMRLAAETIYKQNLKVAQEIIDANGGLPLTITQTLVSEGDGGRTRDYYEYEISKKSRKNRKPLKFVKEECESCNEELVEETAKPLTEDVNNVEVKTENGDVEVSKDGDKVTIDFAPVGEEAPVEQTGEEMIAPLDAEEVAEIEANEPEADIDADVEDDLGLDAAPEEAEVPAEDEFDLEDEEELEDEDLLGAEDFKEESFDYLGNAYLRKIYENVNSFNTTQVSIEDGKLVVEGLIKFESGKEKKTTFVFENAQTSKRGKTILEGKNETFSNSNKAFRLKGVVDNGTFVCETLAYNYTAKQLNESNNEETVKVSGKVIAA